MSLDACISNVIKVFDQKTKYPEEYIKSQPERVEDFKRITKSLYDLIKCSEFDTSRQKSNALSELLIKNFDDEQIWQELELQNGPSVSQFVKKISSLVAQDLRLNINNCNELIVPASQYKEKIHDSSSESDSEDGKDNCEKNVAKTTSPTLDSPAENSKKKKVRFAISETSKGSVVDDRFFRLADLEEFLQKEDVLEEKRQQGDISDDSEDVDLFQDVFSDEDDDINGGHDRSVHTEETGSDSDFPEEEAMDEDEDGVSTEKSGKEAMYEDFFDPPPLDESQRDDTSEEEDAMNDTAEIYDTRDINSQDLREASLQNSSRNLFAENITHNSNKERMLPPVKTPFEKQQEKIQRTIKELEQKNLEEKPWQMSGEVSTDSRPENSLLEEHLLFDHTTRPAPVITEERTATLEDIIKQRIKDEAWDDVERKVKPKEEPFEYRRRVVLDQEKSKLSLAEIYEQEYLKLQQQEEQTDKEVPEHAEVRKMMSSLFTKLDALSNFHYVPKPHVPEVKVVSRLPAITVEEVAPTSVSDAALLAPEEIKEKPKDDLKSKTEETTTDKKRARRKKKLKQRLRQKAKEAKLKLSNPKKQNKLELLEKLKKQKGVTVIENKGKKKKKFTLKS